MSAVSRRLTARLRALRPLFQTDDPALADAGAAGERVLAWVRLALCATMALIPASWAVDPTVEWSVELQLGIGIAATALAISGTIAWLAHRRRLPRAFGIVSGLIDVSMVSAALASFFVIGHPLTAVNSRVVFLVYFVQLAATGLRWDWRVCAVAGSAAVAQYGTILWAATTFWDLDRVDPALRAIYGPFDTTEQFARLVIMTTVTVVAVGVVLRASRLRLDSIRDRMTDVSNRGYFDERLAEEVSRARRSRQPVAVVLLDLDHFKSINDRFGHLVGDRALRVAAAALRGAVRRGDVLARYGGEEFVVLLPDTSARDAVQKAEQLRAAIGGLTVRTGAGRPPLRLSVSAGVAELSHDRPDGPDALLHLADERLYEAKAAGRDRVVGPRDLEARAPLERARPSVSPVEAHG